MEQIDDLVKQEVEVELGQLRPQPLQDEMAKHRAELEEAQKALHNS